MLLQKLAEKLNRERGDTSVSTQEQAIRSFDTPRGLEEAFLNFLAREDTQNPGHQTTILDQLSAALSVSTKYEQLGTVLGGSPFQPDSSGQEKDWEETCRLSTTQWGRVRLLLERLLEEYPKEPLLHHLMAKACLRSGSGMLSEGLEAAKTAVSSCGKETPRWLEDQCKLGLAVSLSASSSRAPMESPDRVKFRQEAEQILLGLLEHQERNPVMLYNLGLIYAEDRQYTQAMKYARSALSIAQGPFGAASALLALILSGRREYKSGLAVIEYGLSESSEIFKCLLVSVKAKLYLALNSTPNAINALKDYCTTIKPCRGVASDDKRSSGGEDAIKAWQALIEMYLSEGQMKEADALLAKMESAAPTYPDRFFLEGIVSQKQKKIEESIQYFEIALALDPCHAKSALALGELYRRQSDEDSGTVTKDLAMAQSLLSEGLRRQPDDHLGWRSLGLVCKSQGRLEEARKYLMSAVSLAASAPVMSFTLLPRFL